MVVDLTIKVEPEEFYEYVTYIIAKQIENMFGDEVSMDQVKKGYSHKVRAINAGKGNKARFTITKSVPGKLFETSYTTGERRTTTSYKIEPSPKGTHLVYTSQTMMFDGTPVKEGQWFGIPTAWEKIKLRRSLRSAVRKIRKARV